MKPKATKRVRVTLDFVVEYERAIDSMPLGTAAFKRLSDAIVRTMNELRDDLYRSGAPVMPESILPGMTFKANLDHRKVPR